MTVIEADGESTTPLVVDSLLLFPGQRYSVVVQADQPIGNYWVRANPNDGNSGFAGGINTAILRYDSAPKTDPQADPTNPPTSVLPLKEADLHSLIYPSAPGSPQPGGADVVLNLVHAFDPPTFKYKINGVTFITPTVPVLLQILSGAQAAQDLLPNGSVYALPPNKVIEISLPGTGLTPGVSTPRAVSFGVQY